MPAPLPPDERERLAALRRYAILDTPPEPAFDRITSLATQTFAVPIALVSLVDQGREWIKSAAGVDPHDVTRDLSFCAHTILSDEVMLVPDARQDPRFVDNPFVTGSPGIRFYAAAPLKTPDGMNVGALCLIDRVPRELADDQVAMLVHLAAIVVDELELRLSAVQLKQEIAEREHVAEALRRSEERFARAFHTSPIAISIITLSEGRLLEVNDAFLRLIGFSRDAVLGRTSEELGLWTHPDDLAALLRMLDEQEAVRDLEVRFRTSSGELRHALASGEILDLDSQRCILILAQDISARKQAEQALRASEQRFRAIFDAAGIGIALDNLDGRPVESNAALQQMLGYTGHELHNTHFTAYTHPDDVAADSALFAELVAGKRDSYQLEKRYIRKDGQVIWGHITVSLVRGTRGEPQFAVVMVEDITERKRVASDLADAQRRLVEIQEAERLRLARALHDSTVQQLLGISYQLVESRQRVARERHGAPSQSADLGALLEVIRQEVLGVVRQLRGVIGGLRPAGLEEFGLAAALEGYVAHLQREARPGMPVIDLDLTPSGTRLPQPVALCLFRAAQEALRNALQHARAQCITLALRFPPCDAVLSVRDDGRGFQVPAHLSGLARAEHFGLVGIAERVAVAGGKLTIQSQPGAGTEVTIRIPLSEVKQDHGPTDSRAARR
ncbi:MAG: PAS domain S-box protein [Chloroflexota bacterium]|nr:PAS domain S-box protein [Chloroflexota bacterium]